jgi:hypothetical protein
VDNGETVKTTRTPAELRAEIERAREQIAETAAALKREMAARADWREWIRRKPALCIAGAFALGFVLSYRRPHD